MAAEWWEDFFSDIVVDFWRKAISEERTHAEADFILELLQVPHAAKILDVPCGQGRLTCELASQGYALTGIDFSLPFLAEARGKAAERRLNIEWQHGDMRKMSGQAEFDGAFCFGNSFGYFDDGGNATFLCAVCQSLKPGARFVLDAAISAETLLPRLHDREWARVDDFLFLEENHYDHLNGRMTTEYTFIRYGQSWRKASSHRVYTYRELFNLIEEAGFVHIESFGSLARDPFVFGSQQLFFVASRRR